MQDWTSGDLIRRDAHAANINSRPWNTNQTCDMYIILLIALVLLSAIAIGVAVANISPV